MRSIGIEVSSSAVRLVELEREPQGVRLLGAATVPTFLFADGAGAEPEAESLAAQFAEVDDALERLAAGGVNVRGGITGITGRELMLRYLDVPDGDEKRQALIVKFELDDILEQSEADLCHDHTILYDPNAVSTQTAVLTLAKDASVQRLYNRLAKLKIAPSRITPSCLALYHAFLLGAETRDGETVMLVSVAYDETELCIVRDGAIVFARNLNIGGKLIAEVVAEERGLSVEKAYRLMLSKLDITPNRSGSRDGTALQIAMWEQADQLTRALESSLSLARIHLKAPTLKLNRLLVAGEFSRMTGSREIFLQRLKVPAETFNPFGLLEGTPKLPEAARRGEWNPAKVPSAYAVAAGLARLGLESSPAASVNLEAASVRAKRTFVHRTAFLYGAAVAVGLLLLSLIVAANEYAGAAQEARRAAQAEEQSVTELAERLIQLQEEADAAKPLERTLRAAVEPTANALAFFDALRTFANEYEELIVEEIRLEPPADADLGRSATVHVEIFFENKGRVDHGRLIDLLLDHLETHAKDALRPGGLVHTATRTMEGFGNGYELRATLARVTR